jgi:hypothetical protein
MVEPEQVRHGLAEIRAVSAEHQRSADAVSAALFAWTAVDADSSWARSTGIAADSASA